MSAVLRKKIEAGAGIPPSMLRLQSFWLKLQTCTREWAADTYGIQPDITLASRRTVSGVEARKTLDQEAGFFFSANLSPGLAGLALDSAGAVRNAAVRMDQDVDSLADASPLFLKLLAEQAGLDLAQSVSAGLFRIEQGVASTADPAGAAGSFNAANRYLLIEYKLQLNEDVTRVWFAFAFDYLQKFIASSLRDAADNKAQARHHSRKSLSDSVLASTTTLDAVLDRLSLTIGECAKLEVGTVLPLSGADAGKLSLSADTLNGCVDIGSGELGVWKRQRALKLTTPISENFAQEIVDS